MTQLHRARPVTSGSGPRCGLTEAQAAERLDAEGRNELSRPSGRPVWNAVVHQLADVVIAVLVVAAALTAAVGDRTDMAVIIAVIVLNTALGVGQELRSGRALAALARLTAPRATVVRDGIEREVESGAVVRDDLIRLAAGDIVPADATLATSRSVQVDESMLTGESLPVDKVGSDAVYAGTVVTRGRADAVVTAVADATELGAIALSLTTDHATRTPVQRQLSRLGRQLAIAVTAAAVIVAVLNLVGGRSVETSVVLAISLAVAAIPESLPAVVSLAQSAAARRMSELGVLTRRLPAVEALGSVTVLATDKTGTLTEGRMTVSRLWTPAGSDGERASLLTAGVLCNDACTGADGVAADRDDPVEVALVEAARDAGVDVAAVRAGHPRQCEDPFDAGEARMATTHRDPHGCLVEIVKGAPERLLPGLPEVETAQRMAEEMAAGGQRVLAVTVSEGDDGRPPRLAGLVAFRDPPRHDAATVVAAFRRAGVRPIMITGDHAITAQAVADAVGIADETQALSVYARVRPEQKREIVDELRSHGEVVAMTGDGVNDAPALRAADVGVAIGSRAAEVARQSADLVLTRDDLSALVPAIAEGRRAYDNLRRFLHYALSGGVAEVLVMLVGPLAGFAVPLQAGQILWVNLLTHGLPGVAMGNEPAAHDVLRRPPRPPGEALLDRVTARRVGVVAVAITIACLGAAAAARAWEQPWQSTLFVTLTFAQLCVAMALRPRGAGWRANPLLPAAVAVNIVLVWLAVAWSPLRTLLHTESLPPAMFAVCAGAALLPGLVAAVQVGTRRAQPYRPTDDGA